MGRKRRPRSLAAYQMASHRAELFSTEHEEAQLAGRLKAALPAEEWANTQAMLEQHCSSTWDRRDYLLGVANAHGLEVR